MSIRFGTDGWRAVIAREFTFENVGLVAQAIADYVNFTGKNSQGIAVGYDARFLSDHFASLVADTLIKNGINVYLVERDCPTPVTAFTIRVRNLAGAVMLTASHNPPEYNGIKFIPEYCHPALPDVTNKIEEFIAIRQKELDADTAYKLPACAPGKLETIDPKPAYFEQIRKMIDLDAIRTAGLKLAVDPMYAAGRGYLDVLLSEAEIEVYPIHMQKNPLFGGRLPDPNEVNLQELKEVVLEKGYNLGLGLDGDADRFGIVDSNGAYLTANQVISLVFYHLIKNRLGNGNGTATVARSIATTHLVDALAKKYGYRVIEVPVGFKYLGQAMRTQEAVLGGEESGGLSINGHIPEKDGVLADLLVAELVAKTGKTPSQLLQEIYQEVGLFISTRVDIHLDEPKKSNLMNSLRKNPPTEFAGRRVVEAKTIDGCKLKLNDSCWVLIRPSGTEPLVRCYMEAHSTEGLQDLESAMRTLVES